MTELEFYKTILKKVKFDDALLKKELGKAIKAINCEQQPELQEWVHKELDQHYANFVDSLMKAKNCSFSNKL